MNCPVCKAANDAGPQCRRCRADLSSLFTMEAQRERALAQAYRAAASGAWPRALAIAEGADALRSDTESRRFLAAAHLAARHYSRALQRYHLCKPET